MAKLLLRHSQTGMERYGVYGFSVTSFFFGPIPLIFRKSWKWSLLYVAMLLVYMLVFVIIAALLQMSEKTIDTISNASGMGIGVAWASIINRLHLKDLLKQGYRIYNFGDKTPEQVSKFVGEDVTGIEQTTKVFE
jgi:Protein of unknown function (DUF2628)